MGRICWYEGISLKNKRSVNMDSLLLKERDYSREKAILGSRM